jgi:hypothetical protein
MEDGAQAQAQAAAEALAAFDNVPDQIDCNQLQGDAIIEVSGCHNICQLTKPQKFVRISRQELIIQ